MVSSKKGETGKHLILLGLAGSYSYGTNNENSDFNIRGVALNRKSDLIGLTQYEQYVDDRTDTVIYTFNKMVSLLLGCNPNHAAKNTALPDEPDLERVQEYVMW